MLNVLLCALLPSIWSYNSFVKSAVIFCLGLETLIYFNHTYQEFVLYNWQTMILDLYPHKMVESEFEQSNVNMIFVSKWE